MNQQLIDDCAKVQSVIKSCVHFNQVKAAWNMCILLNKKYKNEYEATTLKIILLFNILTKYKELGADIEIN